MTGINFCVELGGLGVFILSNYGNIDVERRRLGSCPCKGNVGMKGKD